MSETVTRCPLCGGSQSTLFDQRNFRSHLVSNRLCASCGLVYQSPRMSPADLDDFYAEEYRQMYQGSQGPNSKDLAVQRARAGALYAFASSRLARVERHLDIGCSAGLLLQRFQQAYGNHAVGIEPGNAYREYARQQGVRVYASQEELLKAGEPPFDLVSMAHVLEHLPDPLAYLADLHARLLAPDGWLLVEVPNLYAHDSFEIAHMVSYSAGTLRQTLSRADFEVAAQEQHGRPRSAWVPLYITVLARPASAAALPALQPERGVALKRRLGLLRRAALTRLFPRQAWIPAEDLEKPDEPGDQSPGYGDPPAEAG